MLEKLKFYCISYIHNTKTVPSHIEPLRLWCLPHTRERTKQQVDEFTALFRRMYEDAFPEEIRKDYRFSYSTRETPVPCFLSLEYTLDEISGALEAMDGYHRSLVAKLTPEPSGVCRWALHMGIRDNPELRFGAPNGKPVDILLMTNPGIDIKNGFDTVTKQLEPIATAKSFEFWLTEGAEEGTPVFHGCPTLHEIAVFIERLEKEYP